MRTEYFMDQRSLKTLRTILVLVFLSVFSSPSFSYVGKKPAGETIVTGEHSSPYFFVDGDPGVDSFPLLKTDAKVNIAGVSADVKITQVYKNDGKRTLEAKYVFPMSTKSAIHTMKMTIGDRVIEADIQEKEKARQTYQTAKAEGKVTSLLEQKRPNVFEMNVANIMPGDTVEVEVSYTEIIVPVDAVYEFVYPTVVGPRFTGESGQQSGGNNVKASDESWTASPYLHEGEAPPYTFDIRIELKTGIPLSEVKVTSHEAHVERTKKDEAIAVLRSPNGNGGNKDFIMRYKMQGDKIQTGLLLYPGEEENFFLMMLEPPKKADMEMVPPREYVFIVDVSGSMGGFPMNVTKALMNKIIGGLREKDFFNILFFAGNSQTLFEKSMPATKENIDRALKGLMGQRGSGGTMILNAMQRALSLEKREGISRILVIATDGYVNVEKRVFDLMRDKLGEANFFSFGIGSSVNRYIIDGMARIGKGEPFVVTNQAEAEKAAEKFIDYVRTPLLTDIQVSFNGFDAYDIEPPSMPDLFYKRPLVLFGKYKNAKGSVKVRGHEANDLYEREILVNAIHEDKGNSALKFLWAREKIARLDDYGRVNVNVKKDVTALGLKYHLMTQYTSFVAVDKVVRDTGEVVTVDQPLPLPEGVSDLAVGRSQMKISAAKGAIGSKANNMPTMFDSNLSKGRRAMIRKLPKPKSKEVSRKPASGVAGNELFSKMSAIETAPPPLEEPMYEVVEVESEAVKHLENVVEEDKEVSAGSKMDAMSFAGKASDDIRVDVKGIDATGDFYADADISVVASAKNVKKEQAETKSAPGLYIHADKVPAGITLKELESIILDNIRGDLEELKKQCGFNSVKLALKVESGNVTDVNIKEHNNRSCDKKAIEKIFRKLSFSRSLTSTIELEIKFTKLR